jgi:hypothetical protein
VLDLIGVQTTPLKTKEGPKAVNGGLLVLKHRTGGATGESILWLLRVYRLLILSDARPLLASLNSRSGFQTLKPVETSQAGQIKQRMPAGSPTIEFEPLYRKCLVPNFAARQKAILVLLSLMSLTGVERRRIQAASEATLLLLQSTKLSQ